MCSDQIAVTQGYPISTVFAADDCFWFYDVTGSRTLQRSFGSRERGLTFIMFYQAFICLDFNGYLIGVR